VTYVLTVHPNDMGKKVGLQQPFELLSIQQHLNIKKEYMSKLAAKKRVRETSLFFMRLESSEPIR
jgi:hypothetical protein